MLDRTTIYKNELAKILEKRNQETTEPLNEYEYLIYEIQASNHTRAILEKAEEENN